MKGLTARETLLQLIELLLYYLEDLERIAQHDENQFAYGEKTAYTECLETVCRWREAELFGLDFEVEARYPL